MAKPETYKGDDAVRIKCLKDYTVRAGSGANAGEDTEFRAGATYSLSPRSAAHMQRKVYARRINGKYVGDAPYFVDEKAAKEMADAEAEAKAAGQSIGDMTVAELDAEAAKLDKLPEGWSDMNKAAKVEALGAALASD